MTPATAPRVWQHRHMSGTGHYENFPVASWLCPPRLRPPILALYRYARTADDLADEGQVSAPDRLAALARFRSALARALADQPPESGAWPEVFGPLQTQIQKHQLPAAPLHALLDAFEQDVRDTAQGVHPPNMAALLDYCSRSANPIGRLLLHLYGVRDTTALVQSDAVCSALQLVNFWQDLGQDLRRGRHYLPSDWVRAHGVDRGELTRWAVGSATAAEANTGPAQALVAGLCEHARDLMRQGAPLALALPGRLGWELRLVVQGGLLVLDRMAEGGWRTWSHRPRLGRTDGPRLLWRAATMAWRTNTPTGPQRQPL